MSGIARKNWLYSGHCTLMSGIRPVMSGIWPVMSGIGPVMFGIWLGNDIDVQNRAKKTGPFPDNGHVPDITGHIPDITGHVPDITGHVPDFTGLIPDINFVTKSMSGTRPV